MSFGINNINNYNISQYKPVVSTEKNEQPKTCSNPINSQKSADIPFNGFFGDIFTINRFSSKNEKIAYNELNSLLPDADKKKLDILLKTGKLLNKSSNDASSTLDNLYKIAKTPRTRGLDTQKILSDTISILANPHQITQKFGKLPLSTAQQIMDEEKNKVLYDGLGLSSAQNKKPNDPQFAEDINVDNSGCCVAASIEFNLADKKPAEFARYVEGLTGPENAVKINMHFKDISTNFVDAMNILNKFNVKFKALSWENTEVQISPDRNAIVRARAQGTYQDPLIRNYVDTLMQSTFMQLGSQGTYNTLTDKRYGSFNTNDKGLTELEKNFTETVVDNDGGKTSVTYQNVDDNAKLIGYNNDYNTVLSHLQKTIESGSNVIIGITEVDEASKIIGGHEITITGMRKDKNNELYFICNDTDDDYIGDNEIKATDLIPKIHHAGIPNKILNQNEDMDSGFELLKEYEQAHKQPQQAPTLPA